jgi:hypothetical protein
MKDLFEVQITDDQGLPVLSYRFDHRAWERLQKTLLGKHLLFTDNDGWSDAEIVRAYRGQYQVENAYRCMKDPLHIALRPQYHWTDQKIEVHVFYCVLALMLCSLLERELSRRGIQTSFARALDQLGKIREVAVIYPPQDPKRRPTVKTTLSAMTDEQRTLFEALDLQRYLSTPWQKYARIRAPLHPPQRRCAPCDRPSGMPRSRALLGRRRGTLGT